MAKAKPKTIPATTKSTSKTGKGTTGIIKPLASSGATATGNVSLPTGVGFNVSDLENFVLINPTTGAVTKKLGYEYEESITNIILQQNMMGTSTITIQLTDPTRKLLTSGTLQQGMTLQVASSYTANGLGTSAAVFNPDQTTKSNINTSALSVASLTPAQAAKVPTLDYTLVQFVKAGDQVQLVFEAETVYRLQQQRGNGTVITTNGTNVHAWVAQQVTKLNQNKTAVKNFGEVSVYGPEYSTIWNDLAKGSQSTKTTSIVSVALGQGTTADPYEDTWTAISRIASSIGWRIWENGNTVYFGPDEFWQGNLPSQIGVKGYTQGVPPINNLKYPGGAIQKIQEFTDNIQLIDFDWDVGKPYGQATVTCMLENWQFDIGEIVEVANLGPASGGLWMVSSMQRNAFNPQATVVLTVPMPFGAVYAPTSLPIKGGFPLKPTSSTLKKVVK